MVVLAVAVAACGDKGSTSRPLPDAHVEPPQDAGLDLGVDAPADVQVDMAVDESMAMDVAVDIGVDAAVDVSVDRAADRSVDLAVDRGLDTSRPDTNTADIVVGPVGVLDFDVVKGYPSGVTHTVDLPFAVGDLNGDGRADAVFAVTGEKYLAVVLADARGGFLAPVNLNAPVAQPAIGDVNGDGKLDVFVGNALLLGKGDGSFQPPATLAGVTVVLSPVLVDVDGDGKLDLVGGTTTAGTTSSAIAIFKGDGNGGFSAATDITMGVQAQKVVVADLNGDDRLDLAAMSLGLSSSDKPAVGVSLATGPGVFAAATKIPITSLAGVLMDNTRDLVAADFNHDGKADLVEVDNRGVTILLTNESGTPMPTTRFTASFAKSTSSAVARDFNGDSKIDLALLSEDDSLLTVLLGDGSGGFGPPVLYSTGDRARGMLAGDADGDGKDDLLFSGGHLGVALGRGDGSFHAAPILTYDEARPTSPLIADINGDGRNDLMIAGTVGKNIGVFLGQGQGRFAPATVFSATTEPSQLALATMDPDPNLDLVFHTRDGQVGVMAGDGAGNFAPPRFFPGGYGLAIADLDGDGHPDVLSKSNDVVIVLLNDKAGGLLKGVSYPAGTEIRALATGDLNADGRMDILAGATISNTLAILLGNGDGTFQPATLTKFAGTVIDLAVTDFTGDGKPDVLAVLGGLNTAIDVLPGRGDGTLGEPLVMTAEATNIAVVSDFNGDRRPDLFYTVSNGAVRACLGRGDGSFDPPTYFTTLWTNQMKAGDLNGDGRPDVALASWAPGTGQMILYMNASR